LFVFKEKFEDTMY